ncbi:hypothetical protein [Nannocystis pusilla]
MRDRVAKLMAEPLTLERALQVAMLNNRDYWIARSELELVVGGPLAPEGG